MPADENDADSLDTDNDPILNEQDVDIEIGEHVDEEFGDPVRVNEAVNNISHLIAVACTTEVTRRGGPHLKHSCE
jgi:hypothetical protein